MTLNQDTIIEALQFWLTERQMQWPAGQRAPRVTGLRIVGKKRADWRIEVECDGPKQKPLAPAAEEGDRE